MNILLTGKPGAGKTTLIKKLARELGNKAGGFYTEEIRQKGKRVGFRVNALDGTTGVLAHIKAESNYRFSKYGIIIGGFEKVAIPALEKALSSFQIILIDEIAPMELFSESFKKLVLQALDSPATVVATIKQKGSKFVDSIKSRQDVQLFILSRENFNNIFEKLINLCK